MEDFLDLQDEILLINGRSTEASTVPTRESWIEKFRDIDKYDWDDPEWKKQNNGPFGFLPIPLSQGYFMIVLKRNHKRMSTWPDNSLKKYHAKIDLGEDGKVLGVYGRRSGHGGEEPDYVYAHREVLECLYANGDVDHINGWGLDNRGETSDGEPVNLRLVSKRTNGHNSRRERPVHHGDFSGVEKKRLNSKGQQLYGGKVCKRLGKKVKTFRSKRLWLSPGPANLWYKNKLKKLNGGREMWAHSPVTVNYPVFPPLMDREPSAYSTKLRDQATSRYSTADIPF